LRLQLLGDARDAFKWDLLHWICTESNPRFDRLVVVPMLNPDETDSTEGRKHHKLFDCRAFVRPFLESLKEEPRSLARIEGLGSATPAVPPFDVSIFARSRCLGAGDGRAAYWDGLHPDGLANAVVFFDPDTGLETKSQTGRKWLLHAEMQRILSSLPSTSVAVVYQHRPQRESWDAKLEGLAIALQYARTVAAVYAGDLAFIGLADSAEAGVRMTEAFASYAAAHKLVSCKVLRGDA
jgi:hypothetical protein